MSITNRLGTVLLCLVLGISLLFAYLDVGQQRRRLEREFDRRGQGQAQTLSSQAAALLRAGTALDAWANRVVEREELQGIAIYDADRHLRGANTALREQSPQAPLLVSRVLTSGEPQSGYLRVGSVSRRAQAHAIGQEGRTGGVLLILQDPSDIERGLVGVWRSSFLTIFIPALVAAIGTSLLIRWSMMRPVGSLATWISDLRAGRATSIPLLTPVGLLKPLADEISHLVRGYHAARAEAAEEARLRQNGESIWTPNRLREHCRVRLGDRALVVVSNRQPYTHYRDGKRIQCSVPASGLVTAIEPILRACGGTWVAQASGNADRDVVDEHDRIRVPPDNPGYTLRRVWVSREQDSGFYYGFANEGIWPLCHIAHTRPTFRPSDWASYREVNELFAEAVLKEIEFTPSPLVLIQDYHFALLPRLVKAKRPDARTALFWHIPWPNPEAFGICPWQQDLLEGMLGADLVGFHTQHHCNNFLETVDHALEARLDWENFSVNRQSEVSLVRAFPISVAFTDAPGSDTSWQSAFSDRAAVYRTLHRMPRFLAVGVDRLDYTKGIPERFRAIERFLEKYPQYLGEFTCVELGAPSRSQISRYQELMRDVEAEAARINARFATETWRPIVLLARHHEHSEIEPYYRAADVCLVTSLHDGMNLVAKEFVAARSDERGVLILSQFAGAAHSLHDALIVNPYDTDKVADAIHQALEMDPEERQARMRRLRSSIREHNVYRWAAELISELANVRPQSTPAPAHVLELPGPSETVARRLLGAARHG